MVCSADRYMRWPVLWRLGLRIHSTCTRPGQNIQRILYIQFANIVKGVISIDKSLSSSHIVGSGKEVLAEQQELA